MRNILIFAALMVGAGTYMAQTADRMIAAKPVRVTSGSNVAASARVQQPAPTGSRSLSIPRDARGHFQAANGTIKAARTRLAMVELGGLVVRDVDAMVLPDEALSENLLGLSFLSKLKRFEYAGGKMVLEQ
jgi:aspartyl protease family protein